MFLEEILEADGITLLKWKHLCKEKGMNTKGKIPNWFKEIETKILEDQSGKKIIKDKVLIKTIKYNFELVDEVLVTNEYNLIWNDRIITGGYREWRKKVTDAIWKTKV
ncbi:hypothetical protein RhiirA5_427174 [Rhizophagus irregularis]|uniref:Uncharacterized protein n=1 Tax=Rhizophagus irregularis TaxID=588596 RepID=A0A2N0P2U8_9GLOM|nr:hypothetical protein RhiirA5_427174 [Rhizophagus irregularis]